ncbi:uncharacterized protein LOC126188168 [Schistocerca cancellata]|uniref:uncharacterized protein LOC126188168 n=1 Tax=Schistocerca cancellata TaxID=274614 RepID=UPI002118B5A1|nr:uncharacterized protein LOC126188168 [Schistocerca cancellata]
MDSVECFSAPSWLDKSYYHKILVLEGAGGEIEVDRVDYRCGAARGQGFLSYTVHVNVHYKHFYKLEYKKLKKTFFIKLYNFETYIGKMVRDFGVYRREHELYERVFPEMNSLLINSSGVTARGVKCDDERILVLEDLADRGYCVMNRRLQLDKSSSIAALKCLAEYHAASVILMRKYQDFSERYKKLYLIPENLVGIELHYGSSFDSVATAVGTWPGFEHYEHKIRNFYEKRLGALLHEEDSDSFKVLNHGDLWINNILYKRSTETGEVLHVKLVDFQHAAVGRPTNDLHYFIFSSPQEEVREKYLDMMLEEYHKTLMSTLSALGDDSCQYSLQTLKQDFEDTLMLGFFAANVVLPAVLQDNTEAFDIFQTDETTVTEKYRVSLSGLRCNERFREVYQKLLLYFDRKGLL